MEMYKDPSWSDVAPDELPNLGGAGTYDRCCIERYTAVTSDVTLSCRISEVRLPQLVRMIESAGGSCAAGSQFQPRTHESSGVKTA